MVWWRYDGAELIRHVVPPGLHILTAADLDDMETRASGIGCRSSKPRRRPRPAPRPGPAGWGGWPQLLTGVDSPYDDPRALNVRRDDLKTSAQSPPPWRRSARRS